MHSSNIPAPRFIPTNLTLIFGTASIELVGFVQQDGEAARGIVTVEEAFRAGGLGGPVAQIVAEITGTNADSACPTFFLPPGSAPFLLEHFDLTAEGITAAALDLLKERGHNE